MNQYDIFHELESMILFFTLGGFLLVIIIVYLILSVWYNTRQNKKNTDKIVRILEQYTNISSVPEESHEDWVYKDKETNQEGKETYDDNEIMQDRKSELEVLGDSKPTLSNIALYLKALLGKKIF